MKKFLLIIAAIFCCALGVNAQTPDYFCLTFDMSGSSISKTFYFSKGTNVNPKLEYSFDGTSWNNLGYGYSDGKIEINNGITKIYFRAGENGVPGKNETFSQGKGNNDYVNISYPNPGTGISISVAASGNIMSLLDGKDFETLDTVPNYAFYKFFNSTNCALLTDVAHLRLPAMKLGQYCYSYMFYKCTKITSAPTLPAVTLNKYCYEYMFNECTDLNDVEVAFTSWPGAISSSPDQNATMAWLTSTAANGEFTCPEDLPEVYGSGRIPTDWTVSHPTNYITLNDNEPYTGAKDRTATVTYKRNFESTVWQPLYVPFSIKITEDLLQDCDIADIFMVSTKGSVTAGDDPVDEGLRVTVIKKFIEDDQTEPHTPYFIRPKATGDFEFTQENTTVYAAKEGMVDCSTTKDKYEFIGNYSAKTLSPTTGIAFYVLGTSGGLKRVAKTADYDLAANRWYMQKKSKSGTVALDADEKMSVVVLGEDDTTGIEGVSLTPALSTREGVTYNLQGQRVNTFNGYRGMVVKGGKKFIVK